MGTIKDLTGQRFGRLVVVNYHHSNRGAFWLCRCDCGNETIAKGTNLRYGSTKSCGCGSIEQAQKNCATNRQKGHQLSKTPIYKVWKNMKRRCYSKTNKRYANYGGKGVVICEAWLNDFRAFYDWAMANGYRRDLSIDRIDVNGNYCPENCRWATAKEQANNTTRNHYITYKGEINTAKQWSEKLNMTYATFQHRIQRGWTMERIANTPIRRSVNGHYST